MFSARKSGAPAGGYSINNSLRFQSASSQYLSRTPASAGNRTTWTWSAWVKRGRLAQEQNFMSYSIPGIIDAFGFNSSDGIYYFSVDNNGASVRANYSTSAVFRDPSAWYHIVFSIDTTQATASNRLKIYINGVQQTLTTTVSFAQNWQTYINSNLNTGLGGYYTYLDGYMTEVNFIDGQALTPSSFGETNTLTGQWVAKKYTGTYGTNGFYLPFSNGTSTTTLGADSSGNGNNWTLTNFTRSAGVSDCWMIDVPSGNGGASGTQPSSNYCVFNPLKVVGGNTVASAANLKITSSANAWGTRYSTIGMDSGKWYWEGVRTGNTYGACPGMATDQLTNGDGSTTGGISWAETGTVYNEGGTTSGPTWATNDVLRLAYDADSGTLQAAVNGGSFSTIATGKSGRIWFPVAKAYGGSDAFNINFGQRSFAYTPPSGYKALCTANLPASTIVKGNQYMDATLYSSDASGNALTVTNAAGFKPDLVWIKCRSAAYGNVLQDSVRGASNYLVSNNTGAENQYGGTGSKFNSFNSNGFSLLSGDTSIGFWNYPSNNFVGWQWQAGQGTTSSNTNGTITSTVSVSTTAGFSIVTYTGNSTSGATIGHGLGVAPKMIITKTRNTTIGNWGVYHEALGATKGLNLNTTVAAFTGSAWWNNTAPTSSVFTVGSGNDVNGASTYVAYCFAEIAGFSKFGSYTANGSTNGPFVYCGFRPKFVMIKCSTVSEQWVNFDAVRVPYNEDNAILYPSLANAESTSSGSLDLLSNGFKIRSSSTLNGNNTGQTYIYMAFAENPFAQANAR